MTLLNLTNVDPNSLRRLPYPFYNAKLIAATTTTNAFDCRNITGCVIWFKATSVIGTPALTLTLETSMDDVDANYLQVNATSTPSLPGLIADENVHIIPSSSGNNR